MFKESYIEDYLKKGGLLEQKPVLEALTHKSSEGPHYERLEFLGDSVLGLCISDYLYSEMEETDVGAISKLKGYLVSKDVLYRIATENNVIKFIVFGSALTKKEIKNNKKIMSDIIESLIGAIYLLKGFEEVNEFIMNIFKEEFKNIDSKKDLGDYKSELQMKVLAKGTMLPEYTVVNSEGKEHKKTFYVEVALDGRVIGKGKGKTIKEAEQAAAKKALGSPKIKEADK
ncbi:MAG: Ribonuclease 3 [Candidatus Aerophobetes bacterium ADurb.Bin490]|nr:MAG: Ribonuclease 3 [Candidatus Aerophobetes bacterium ADurb.Bin490]HPI04421.1 ribonuclease III [Candidatus Goldiibacteriota bacterium]HPN65601.1 ribonuclease III [Candidatus Goldiibacteriota bacterium]HRQ43217.1 ribonuclease III [Candidatus Goldiibacteriota bacterium]